VEEIVLDALKQGVYSTVMNSNTKGNQMLKVTFRSYSKVLRKEFFNVEIHRSMADAKLRALALMWEISKVEAA
jgi:hypothetical protein